MSRQVLKNLYGVGFSPLSINNKRYAHPEELMAAKESGLLAIFQADGTVASSEYILRSKKHLSDISTTCIHDNTMGKVYKIAPDENMVQYITESVSLFTNELSFENGYQEFEYMRFFVDYDCFKKETNTIFNPSEIKVKINFTVQAGEEEKHYNIEEALTDISTKAYAFDYEWHTDVPLEQYGLTINSFELELPEGFDEEQVGLVIYDILMVLR